MTDREAFEKWCLDNCSYASNSDSVKIFDEHIKPLLDALEEIEEVWPAAYERGEPHKIINVYKKALAEWRKKVGV